MKMDGDNTIVTTSLEESGNAAGLKVTRTFTEDGCDVVSINRFSFDNIKIKNFLSFSNCSLILINLCFLFKGFEKGEVFAKKIFKRV